MINEDYYKELKNDFLSRHYGNTDFDHPQYIKFERAYKDELIDVFRNEVSEAPKSTSAETTTLASAAEKAIDVFFHKLQNNGGKVQNLVGFRYSNFLKKLGAESKIELSTQLSNLLYGPDMLIDRIDVFLAFLKNVNADSKYPYSSACGRAIFSFYLFLSDPDKHMFIRTQDLHNCLKKLTGQGLDPEPSGAEYERVIKVASELRGKLLSDGWTPRDLADIYTFLWLPWGDTQGNGNSIEVEPPEGELDLMIPLNTIMYGPPGTGKTYSTVNKALEILDSAFLAENRGNRVNLKARYDQLTAQGRIALVTFHQSFSYEDFVEGLRAETDEQGNIHYRIRDGVFKRLCNRETAANSKKLDEAIRNLQEKTIDVPVELKTVTGKTFKVSYNGGSTFSINPTSSDNDRLYPASIEHLRRLYLHGSSEGVYNTSYVKGILEHLISQYDLDQTSAESDEGASVLIIDEINRGNVANIFGELITLLEESKRRGNAEELGVTLPYSGEILSIPNDLYVVGTMNTADRSLSVLDTALRRRFEFEAIYPDHNLLSGVVVDGVNIRLLLETLNKRIAILYDREHLIGHSFFMGLTNNSTIKDLKRIFEKHILPTLEEYFFEDWNRIRQILGDHLKQSEPQFLISRFNPGDIEIILGDDLSQEVSSDYFIRNANALDDARAYIGIYESSAAETIDA